MENILVFVPQQERWVIELVGRFWRIWQPGPHILVPGIMNLRKKVDTRERPIPLFAEPIKIDFKDGSAIPKGARVFVRIKDPDSPYVAGDNKTENGIYRSVYEINDPDPAIQDLMENALRSFFNNWTIDEALKGGKAGYNLADRDPGNGIPNDQLKKIDSALAVWGYELCKTTVQDFDLDAKIVEARDTVQIREKEKEAMDFEVQADVKRTIGKAILMMAESRKKAPEEIQGEIEKSEEFQREIIEFSKTLILRDQSIKGKAMNDIWIHGSEGGLQSGIVELVAILKGLSERKGGETEQKKGVKKVRWPGGKEVEMSEEERRNRGLSF